MESGVFLGCQKMLGSATEQCRGNVITTEQCRGNVITHVMCNYVTPALFSCNYVPPALFSCNYVPPALFSCRDQHFMMLNHPVETSVGSTPRPTPCTQNELNRRLPAHSVNHLLAISSWSSAREIGMCICGDNHFHVYTSTEGRKLSSPRHFKWEMNYVDFCFLPNKCYHLARFWQKHYFQQNETCRE